MMCYVKLCCFVGMMCDSVYGEVELSDSVRNNSL